MSGVRMGTAVTVKDVRIVVFQSGFDSWNRYSACKVFFATIYSCSKQLEVNDVEDDANWLVKKTVSEQQTARLG